MNYFTKSDLINSLKGLIAYIELNYNEGTVVVSEYGARVLGMFPKKECINLLWVNPLIKDLITKNEWNIGGDRYWISPERLFFYKNPESWESWFCPEGLDPADFKITSSSNTSCLITSDISLTNQLNKKTYNGKIKRYISLVKEPIKTGVAYCGIQYLDDCTLFVPDLQINGWTLTQIISGGTENPGTVLIPTKKNPKPQSYFRTIPNDRIKIMDTYVAFKIDVDDIYKLAIRPEDIDLKRAGKIGYILKIPNSEDYCFMIKVSFDIPDSQEQCFDISRDHPDAEIGVIQSYNAESPDKSNLMFGEIELQLNPFRTVYQKSQGFAKHQLFGYLGTKEEILNVVEKYLGILNPKLF